jgi:hypothetical protein
VEAFVAILHGRATPGSIARLPLVKMVILKQVMGDPLHLTACKRGFAPGFAGDIHTLLGSTDHSLRLGPINIVSLL